MSTIGDIRGLKVKTTGGEINVPNYLATSTFRAPDVQDVCLWFISYTWTKLPTILCQNYLCCDCLFIGELYCGQWMVCWQQNRKQMFLTVRETSGRLLRAVLLNL